jgi:hypothetical protein
MNEADALVESGYADSLAANLITVEPYVLTVDGRTIKVDPYYTGKNDKRFGIACRQADALVDFLQIKHDMLWVEGWLQLPVNPENMSMRERLLTNIKWCFEQLGKDND